MLLRPGLHREAPYGSLRGQACECDDGTVLHDDMTVLTLLSPRFFLLGFCFVWAAGLSRLIAIFVLSFVFYKALAFALFALLLWSSLESPGGRSAFAIIIRPPALFLAVVTGLSRYYFYLALVTRAGIFTVSRHRLFPRCALFTYSAVLGWRFVSVWAFYRAGVLVMYNT